MTLNFPQFTTVCSKILVTQTLVFSGVANFHPLQQACGPQLFLTATETRTTDQTFTFTTPGTYGYYCNFHGGGPTGGGMTHSILVQ